MINLINYLLACALGLLILVGCCALDAMTSMHGSFTVEFGQQPVSTVNMIASTLKDRKW